MKKWIQKIIDKTSKKAKQSTDESVKQLINTVVEEEDEMSSIEPYNDSEIIRQVSQHSNESNQDHHRKESEFEKIAKEISEAVMRHHQSHEMYYRMAEQSRLETEQIWQDRISRNLEKDHDGFDR